MSDEAPAIIALVRPAARLMADLSLEGRMTLLLALLAQEICNLPVGERDDEMRRVFRDFPGILDQTEEGMRQALAMNARTTP